MPDEQDLLAFPSRPQGPPDLPGPQVQKIQVFTTPPPEPLYWSSITDCFKPYIYVLLREQLDHKQFVEKMARENNGTITVSTYMERHNLLDDCIAWMKYYFPGEHWSVNIVGKSRTILDYLEHCKYKLSRRLGYCDDSPKFKGNTFTAVITKNVVFVVQCPPSRRQVPQHPGAHGTHGTSPRL